MLGVVDYLREEDGGEGWQAWDGIEFTSKADGPGEVGQATTFQARVVSFLLQQQ